MIMEKLFRSVEVELVKNRELDIFSLLIILVYDTSSVKELLVMCASENEQRQWIAKLSKKVPRLPIPQSDPPRYFLKVLKHKRVYCEKMNMKQIYC